MVCQRCKIAAATVCVSRVINGQKHDIYLCRDCANKSAAAELKKAFAILDTLPGHFVFGGSQGNVIKKVSVTRCDGCGKSLAEIQKDGKIGCEKCYDTFRIRLRPIVLRIHKTTKHKGIAPHWVRAADSVASGIESEYGANKSAGADADAGAGCAESGANENENANVNVGVGVSARHADLTSYDELKAALDAAVLAEEYERAAVFRDKIKELGTVKKQNGQPS